MSHKEFEMSSHMSSKIEISQNAKIGADGFFVNVLIAIGAVIAACVVLQTIFWETRNLFAVPWYDDMFDHTRMHHAMGSLKAFISYMISPHNEHRIFTTRVISFLDERFLSGREYGQVLATNFLQTGAALITWVAFIKSGIFENRYLRLALLPTILLFFVNPNFLYTLVIPFQLQFGFMACICVTAAFVVSQASSVERPTDLEQIKMVCALLALAIVATFTLGNSPVVLLASAATAVVLRWKRSITATLILLAVAHVVIMLAITPATGSRTHNPALILKFSLMYLGGAFTRVDPWPGNFLTWSDSPSVAAIIGTSIFATAIGFAIARFLRPGLGGRLATFGFMLLTVVIITSLAGGLARAQFGVLEALNKKYASFSALSWIGAYAVLSGVAFNAQGPRRRFIPASMAIALALVLAFTLNGANREERLWSKARNATWEAALAGFVQVNDRDELHTLDDRESEVPEYMRYASAWNIGVFSYFPFRIGDDAAEFLAARKEITCKGEVESVSPVSANSPRYFDVSGSPAAITGWAWMTDEHKPATTVIAVDAADHIVGAARSTRRSARAEEWLAQTFDQNLGWFGYARPESWQGVKFFALSSSGKQFCALGAPGSVR